MSSAVDQPTSTGLDTAPDSATVNVAGEPSDTAPPDVTETVTVPVSEIVVCAGVGSAVTSPADVLAPLSVTSSVSPSSTTESGSVAIAIVPLASAAPSVSVPDGAV